MFVTLIKLHAVKEVSFRLFNVALCIPVLKTLYFCGRRNGHCFFYIHNAYEKNHT